MNVFETISIDVYPWAAPTAGQRAWFDSLSPQEKRKAILAAIEEGFNSSLSDRTVEDILKDMRAKNSDAS